MDSRPPPRNNYHSSDTFFIESDDHPAAMDPRERVRLMFRDRQLIMAEDLSTSVAQEYQQDILRHMERMELETLPDAGAIEMQMELQWFMRPYLLDFLIEAHAAFQLHPETLFLAVNLLDRYCSRRVVYKRHYQLVGCAALFIASKYGDRKDRVPTIAELKSMCCGTYDEDMFEQMEWHMLITLDWCIGHPTVESFLQIAISTAAHDPEVEHMARFVAEMAMFHRDYVSIRPSVMARSALAVARCLLNRPQAPYNDWAGAFDTNLMVQLSQILDQPSRSLSRKYASSHLSSVAATLERWVAHQALVAMAHAGPTSQDAIPIPEVQHPGAAEGPPQTPQKAGLPAIPFGVPSPPITPEGQGSHVAITDKEGDPPPYLLPQTPSSIRSFGHANAGDHHPSLGTEF